MAEKKERNDFNYGVVIATPIYACVSQLAEDLICNQDVAGSIPVASSI